MLPFTMVTVRSGLLDVGNGLFHAWAVSGPTCEKSINRAGVSKFYFGCFQNVKGSNSAVRAVPELRIELPATLEHARGPEIGQKA